MEKTDLHYVYRDTAPAPLNSDLGALTSELLAEANRRHDAALHEVSTLLKAKYSKVDWERFNGVRRGRV